MVPAGPMNRLPDLEPANKVVTVDLPLRPMMFHLPEVLELPVVADMELHREEEIRVKG